MASQQFGQDLARRLTESTGSLWEVVLRQTTPAVRRCFQPLVKSNLVIHHAISPLNPSLCRLIAFLAAVGLILAARRAWAQMEELRTRCSLMEVRAKDTRQLDAEVSVLKAREKRTLDLVRWRLQGLRAAVAPRWNLKVAELEQEVGELTAGLTGSSPLEVVLAMLMDELQKAVTTNLELESKIAIYNTGGKVASPNGSRAHSTKTSPKSTPSSSPYLEPVAGSVSLLGLGGNHSGSPGLTEAEAMLNELQRKRAHSQSSRKSRRSSRSSEGFTD